MPVSKEQLIQAVAQKVGPEVTLEAKLEKGIWRITLTKENKTARLELKREFVEDFFEEGEYQQELAFETRITKVLRGLK